MSAEFLADGFFQCLWCWQDKRKGGGIFQLVDPQSCPKATALAWLALHADIAVHHSRQVAANDQAKTGTPIFARRRVVGLDEGAENPRLLLFRQSDALIADFKQENHCFCFFLLDLEAKADFALFREFDGVAQEVDRDLIDAQAVTMQARG